MRNGHEVKTKSYDTNNNNRYFCENGTYTNENVCSFAGGTEIKFDFNSSDTEVFGLESPQKLTKVVIRRYKNTGATLVDGGDEKYVSIGFKEIKFKGYVP